jgi:hypothetical protein
VKSIDSNEVTNSRRHSLFFSSDCYALLFSLYIFTNNLLLANSIKPFFGRYPLQLKKLVQTEHTVDSPQIGHAPDPDKPVALRVCPISRPQCKFNSELQIGQLSDSRTKIPTYRTICSFFAQHSSEPDGPSPEEKTSLLAM